MDKYKVQYFALLVCLTTGTVTAQYRYARPSKSSRAPAVSFASPPSTSYRAPTRPPGRQQQPSGVYGAPPSPYSPGGNNGYYNEPANYQFQYDVDAPYYGTNFGHQEARQGDVAQGEYYVRLPDGRTQHVTYVADQDGYRPKITYEGGGQGNFGGY